MNWFHRLWRRRQLEQQLEKELRFHLDQHTSDLMARGLPPDEARQQARRSLGGAEQIKENCRDARGTRWLEDLVQDVQYALRTLRQKPGFAAVALITLALGTGATTLMFTLVNGVLLKPLSYPQPERLVSLHEETEKYGGQWSFSYLNFLDCRAARSFSSLEAWRYGPGTVSEPGTPAYVEGRQISAGLFTVLGITPQLGRGFRPEEDRAGATPVAIISHRLWQHRFRESPSALGARLIFNAQPYNIVGVAPAALPFASDAEIFTPLGQNNSPVMQNREMHPGINVIARLRPGVTLVQAQAELTHLAHRLAEEYPKSNAGHNLVAQPMRQELVRDVRPTLFLLLGAVSLVLLIACVNVASLLLARAVSRERELAMRVALGAGRGRLVRQCLTESAVLGCAGGLLGILLASFSLRPFLRAWPGSLPRAAEVHLDGRVLLFALSASLLSGLLFGLAPALRAPARELERTLRAGARSVSGGSRRLHSGFIVSEIALAVVLLVAAGTLARTLLHLAAVNPGIDTHNVLVTRVALSSDATTTPARLHAAWPDILDRVRRVPGVKAAAIADIVPFGGDDEEIGFWTTPAAPAANQMPLALLTIATPDYLRVMGISLLNGRAFTPHDGPGGEPVILIDEVLAHRAFGDQDPVGRRLFLQFLGATRVVGVVNHVSHWGVAADHADPVREQIYMPLAFLPDEFLRQTAPGMSLVVRTEGPPLNSVEAIRTQVRGAARDQVLYEVRTMDQLASASLALQRFLLLLFAVFAALALLLASIGIYGVLAYLTNQRAPEIGVRMALGASARGVMALIFRQSLAIIALGLAFGLAGAAAAARLLERFVSGAQPTQPLTFVWVVAVLLAAALLATFFPARRASRLDPLRALRQE